MQIPTTVYFAPILILLTCYFSFVTPLKCVICNSETNKLCADGSAEQLSAFSADCKDANKSMGGVPGVEWKTCRKIITFVDFDVNDEKGGITRVFRRCGYEHGPDDRLSCFYRGGLGGRQRVCTCNDADNCNSGHSLTTTVFVTLLAPIAIIGLYRYQQ